MSPATPVQDLLFVEGLGRHASAFASFRVEDLQALRQQDYGKLGVVSTEDKQKLYRLVKQLSGKGGARAAAGPSPRQRGSDMPGGRRTSEAVRRDDRLDGVDAGAAMLDLEDEDADLLSQNTEETPLSTTQFIQQTDPPKITVVVRKRPLNSKEIEAGEGDCLEVDMESGAFVVHEPKVKVDLSKYVEMHQFAFDNTLDEAVTNDQVYRSTVKPLVATLFRGGKATCFAYGQTGSGKTYTMQPLPIRAAADMLMLLADARYSDVCLWVSCFEIYGGKLFDLLNSRNKLEIREDRGKRVCIVGLKEYCVEEVDRIEELASRANATRSTGATGANADSSRSHSIMQFALKKAGDSSRVVGKLSFIDLAGNERGADTYDNDRQTRMEGAEINKSLLALKECIRALDSEARHVPFRGSKLTEVLRDSFVGAQARTVMIANVSPNSASCEHTLNTLRYADRVKELRKEKDARLPGKVTPGAIGAGGNAYAVAASAGPRAVKQSVRRASSPPPVSREVPSHKAAAAPRARLPTRSPRRQSEAGSEASDARGHGARQSMNGELARGRSRVRSADGRAPRPSAGVEKSWAAGKPPGVQPSTGRRGDAKTGRARAQSVDGSRRGEQQKWKRDAARPSQDLPDVLEKSHDTLMQAILEEEEELISAHRAQIERNMSLVRDEMNLLGEVDKQGSVIDTYVEKLALLLREKASETSSLQAKLALFQRKLREEEQLSHAIGMRHAQR